MKPRDTRDGATRIADERRRQTEAEGWTPEHDDCHADSELAMAAVCYAAAAAERVFVRRPTDRDPTRRSAEDDVAWVGPAYYEVVRVVESPPGEAGAGAGAGRTREGEDGMIGCLLERMFGCRYRHRLVWWGEGGSKCTRCGRVFPFPAGGSP